MAGISGVLREAAFVAFEVEFHEMGRFLQNLAVCSYFARKLYWKVLHFHSFQILEGLIRLLRAFALKPGKTPEQGRARLYRWIWAILWVS